MCTCMRRVEIWKLEAFNYSVLIWSRNLITQEEKRLIFLFIERKCSPKYLPEILEYISLLENSWKNRFTSESQWKHFLTLLFTNFGVLLAFVWQIMYDCFYNTNDDACIDLRSHKSTLFHQSLLTDVGLKLSHGTVSKILFQARLWEYFL